MVNRFPGQPVSVFKQCLASEEIFSWYPVYQIYLMSTLKEHLRIKFDKKPTCEGSVGR